MMLSLNVLTPTAVPRAARMPRLSWIRTCRGACDAFNPAELLLVAVAACMIKGIERVAPMTRELRVAYSTAWFMMHRIR
jgi:hypothetical protein